MITRGATVTSRMAVIFAILFAVAACGGGGGGDDGFIPDSAGGGSGKLTLKLVLLDTDGNETNIVTSAAAGILKVTIKGKSDLVVSTTTDIGLVFPASGTALTNADGVATFQIEAGAEKGAGTITSTAQNDDGETFTGTLPFQVGDSGLRLGYFDSDGDFIENEIGIQPGSVLASQGRAQLSVAIVDEDSQRVSSAANVRISSGCLSTGQATLDPASPLISGDGQVSATYGAVGCSGTDELTASLVGANGQAFGSVTIASPEATGLTFISADPRTIVLRGTGGGSERKDSSNVTFQVVASNGSPIQGVNVDFSLTTSVGGLTVSPASALSSSDGTVRTTVFSGDVATVVRVIASTQSGDGTNQAVSTVSDVLTVTTGLPDQNSISLSVAGGFVVEDAYTRNGQKRTITVSMADTFNNPVPNGTAAVFTTEYGAIDPSCETGLKNGDRLGGTPTLGTCSVLWTNENPKSPALSPESVRTIRSQPYNCPDGPNGPGHSGSSGPCPNDLGYTRGGRSTLVVTAIGQETFVDSNGNGVMDQEEKDRFVNLPEAFLDNNEDGAYTPALQLCKDSPGSAQCIAGAEEQFTDFNTNGRYDLNDNPAVYDGLLCPPEGDGVWCTRGLINVRASTGLTLSNTLIDDWDIALYQGRKPASGTSYNGGEYTAYISDIYNSRPPAGSTVKVTAGGDCEVISADSFTVSDTFARGAFTIKFATGGVGTQGAVDITLTPMGDGTPYTESFNCVPEPPPPPEDPNDPDGNLGGGVG